MRTKQTAILAGLCFFGMGIGSTSAAKAQETHPPKLMQLDVEYVKPDKAGEAHEKAEAAISKMAADAKSDIHHIALRSMSGAPRVLFIFGYDSFDDLSKSMDERMQNKDVMGKINAANDEDAELLTSKSENFYMLRPDLSHNTNAPLKELHYFEITRVKVKVGHNAEWEEYLKMLSKALDKSAPDRHLAVYRSAYGENNGGIWALFMPVGSLADLDKVYDMRDNMAKSMGAADYKHFSELAASSVESSQRNLFRTDPGMSYPFESWVKGDPSFWQTK